MSSLTHTGMCFAKLDPACVQDVTTPLPDKSNGAGSRGFGKPRAPMTVSERVESQDAEGRMRTFEPTVAASSVSASASTPEALKW